MYVEQPYHRVLRAQSPFERGVLFVRSRFLACIAIGVVASTVYSLGLYLQHYFPLSAQEQLLVIFLRIGSLAWLIMSSFLLAAEGLAGRPVSVLSVAARALAAMPKVVLSFLCFLVAALFAVNAPPIVVFVMFLLWAPFFCAGEYYSPPIPRREPDDDESTFDDDGPGASPRIRPGFFRYRPLWDLGFARSVQFTSRNFLFTLQYALILWVTAVGPHALVVLFAGYYLGFEAHLVQTMLAGIAETIAAVIGAVGFISVLPQDAVNELKSDEKSAAPLAAATADGARADNRNGIRENLPFLFLVLIGIGATHYFWSWIQHEVSIPPGVHIEAEKAELLDGRLLLVVRLEDPEFRLRWFMPESFRLDLRPADPPAKPAPAKPAETTVAETSPTPQGTPAEPELPSPARAMPYALDGSELSEENFTPYAEPLRLKLYFEVGEAAGTRGTYSLLYVTPFGKKETVLNGEYAAAPGGPEAPPKAEEKP